MARTERVMEPEELIYLRLDINAHVPIATKMRIAGLLARLPEQVCKFAIKKIFFYSMGQHARLGMASHRRDIGHWEIITEYGFHYRTDYEWLVWLLDEEVENGDEGLATIAHEIAHAWLRHRQYQKDETREARAGASLPRRTCGFAAGYGLGLLRDQCGSGCLSG